MDAVERRHRRAPADDAEGGSDPVPGQRRPGGTSLASDDDFFSARAADDVIPAGGVGAFTAVVLDKLLNGEGARRPAVHQRDQRGHARRERAAGPRDDVPAAVPALHAPRADPAAFAAMKSQALALLANQIGEPGRGLRPGARHRAERQPSATPAGDAGNGGEMEPRQVAGVLQGALRRRRATSPSSSSAASRSRASGRSSRPTSPACRPRDDTRRGATSASRRPRASSRRQSRRGSRRRARSRSCSAVRSSTTTRTSSRCRRRRSCCSRG